MTNTIKEEIQKRRTFAVVSHPDAGKTTITEKFLWFGNVIREAGHVKAKSNKKFATSDWMEIEKKRGISVTSSALSFPYEGCQINLVDTPGHQDFCEDTYRALVAVDSALVLLDAAKGVEPQTIKLMDACKLRKVPITVFINKMDRDSRDIIELMDEVEEVLGLKCAPMTLPIGSGQLFQGVYSLEEKSVHFFSKDSDEPKIEFVSGLNDSKLDEWFDEKYLKEMRERAELVQGVMDPFNLEEYRRGEMAPVYFGSAINNFGVKQLLDSFVRLAPSPLPRKTREAEIDPFRDEFSGFVFKIQANMDPKHRDRVAYLRVCSGSCDRGQKIYHCRTGRFLKMSAPTSFMAQEKSVIEKAYAGDIIGIHDPGHFSIGDTLTSKDKLEFQGIPDFPSEYFARVVLLDPLKSKQLAKGLRQLSEEGAVQLFYPESSAYPMLGVVGKLQFEVIQARIESEYGAKCQLEPISLYQARWLSGSSDEISKFVRLYKNDMAKDKQENWVYLCPNEFRMNKMEDDFPEIHFSAIHYKE